VYTPAENYNSLDDAGKHLLHARAALTAQHGQVALAGPSAAALHGFALYGQDLAPSTSCDLIVGPLGFVRWPTTMS